MKTKIRIAALALALVLSLSACGGKTGKEPKSTETGLQDMSAPGEESRTYTDDCGRMVEIPGRINRIVPSGPLSQIILYAIAPDMFVGLASKWDDCARGIVPETYFALPYFGQLYGSANLNIEELAAVSPQLIVDIGEAKKSIVQDMDELQEMTLIPSVHIEASLQTMPDAFRKLGSLLGREEQGETLAQFCEKIYAQTEAVMTKVGENKVNALYVLGAEGLNVLAKGSYHAELIDMLTNNVAVVDNPAGKGTGNEVTMEQIALWNPDFVLFAPDSIYDTAAQQDAWKEISAIAKSRYVEVPEGPHNWMGSPPAVQRYLGLIWLTAELYPDDCDYDVKAEILEYYQLFYNCALSEEQYSTLTENAFLK